MKIFPPHSAEEQAKQETTIMKSTLAVLALAALILPAQAEEKKEAPKGKGGDPAKMLKRKDADKNGSLSLEEFLKGAKDTDKATKMFKRKDKDKDGELSLDELKAGPPKGKGKKKGGE